MLDDTSSRFPTGGLSGRKRETDRGPALAQKAGPLEARTRDTQPAGFAFVLPSLAPDGVPVLHPANVRPLC